MAALLHGLPETVDNILLLCKSHNNETSDHYLWTTLSHNEAESTPDGLLLLDFKVRVGGLGSYYIDGAAFLKKLIQSCTSVQELFSGSGSTMAALQCRRIGDNANVSVFEYGSSNAITSESVLSRPYDFTGLTLQLRMIKCDSETTKVLFCSLRQHLLVTHLVNPQMSFHLDTSISHIKDLSITIDPSPWQRVASTSFKLSSIPYPEENRPLSKLKKMRVLHGSAIILPNYELRHGLKSSLKLSSCVGVFPHMRVIKGKKIPADRVCNKLQVTFFGPGNIVLSMAKSCFDVHQLVDWSDYRLTITDSNGEQTNRNDPLSCNSSFEFALSSNAKSGRMNQRILKVFIFIEEVDNRDEPLLYKRSLYHCWAQYAELILTLRKNFARFLVNVGNKLRRLVRSALNKLICNYGSFKEVFSTVKSAIPVLSDAVSEIIKTSPHESFKQECLSVLKVVTPSELDTVISSRLTSLVCNELGVELVSTGDIKCPDEPSTPELEQAIEQGLTVASNNNNTNSERILENIEETTESDENHSTENDISTHVCTSLYSARISSIASEQVVPTLDTRNEMSDDNTDHFESLLNYEQMTFGDNEPSNVNIEGNEESWNELDIFNSVDLNGCSTESSDPSRPVHSDVSVLPLSSIDCFDELEDVTIGNYQNLIVEHTSELNTQTQCYNDNDFLWD